MARVKNSSSFVATFLLQLSLFCNVDCFAGDYNTNPKIRINYLSQNSGKKFLRYSKTDTNKSWLQMLFVFR